jgi:pyruvate/2-oxoglutarate dehydrogenase complex dihydrolipoamide acyltransferase (E2) component
VAVGIVMPRLSDSLEEGTVAWWLVEEGARVARGQPLAQIDKAWPP